MAVGQAGGAGNGFALPLGAPLLEREQEQRLGRRSMTRIHTLKSVPPCSAFPFSKREAVVRQAQVGQIPLDARNRAYGTANPRTLGHALGPLFPLAPTVD